MDRLLGEKVARYRGRHKMSQDDFAKKCGVSRMTVRNIEEGNHSVTRRTEEMIKIVLEEDD